MSIWRNVSDAGPTLGQKAFVVLTVAVMSTGAMASAGAETKTTSSTTSSTTTGAEKPEAQEPEQDEIEIEDLPSGSMYRVVDQIGARQLWQKGYTGEGVTVAVIDTGVAPVPALSGSDKVVAMVDLSTEAGIPEAEFLDTYGHGTHMTGIIAGRDPGADPATAQAHPEQFFGVAPGAEVVSVKVGDNTGAVDVTQVIAGIEWVIAHRDDLGIDVLNLSYGTDASQPYQIDPLAYAVEQAWQAGIVVVVAAGNDGRGTGRLADPALDPYVIAVAAAQPKNGKWKVPSWVTSGDGVRNPDLAAPGASIESLRAPGSRIDVEHPEGYVSPTRFKGSGSSQAAAVVSGSAALLLDARPDLTPDQVKAILMGTADPFQNAQARFQGKGLIDLVGALSAPIPENAAQKWTPSDGSGSIAASRGGDVVILAGVKLSGETTAIGTPWVGRTWRGAAWTNGTWDGRTWRGATWRGASWTGAQWTGRTWRGDSWTGVQWTSAAWTGRTWRGDSWTSATWTGRTWRDAAWDGRTWRDESWTGRTWRGGSWT